jgi:hypothetical protein
MYVVFCVAFKISINLLKFQLCNLDSGNFILF